MNSAKQLLMRKVKLPLHDSCQTRGYTRVWLSHMSCAVWGWDIGRNVPERFKKTNWCFWYNCTFVQFYKMYVRDLKTWKLNQTVTLISKDWLICEIFNCHLLCSCDVKMTKNKEQLYVVRNAGCARSRNSCKLTPIYFKMN